MSVATGLSGLPLPWLGADTEPEACLAAATMVGRGGARQPAIPESGEGAGERAPQPRRGPKRQTAQSFVKPMALNVLSELSQHLSLLLE